MEARPTQLDADDYLRSLSVERKVTPVYATDGAALFRVDDEHSVLITCLSPDCGPHRGAKTLRRSLPAHWAVFARRVNADEHFEAFHYGPPEAP